MRLNGICPVCRMKMSATPELFVSESRKLASVTFSDDARAVSCSVLLASVAGTNGRE